jgi:hypothetical protein
MNMFHDIRAPTPRRVMMSMIPLNLYEKKHEKNQSTEHKIIGRKYEKVR